MSITPELPVYPWAHEYSSSQNFQVGPRITWIIVSSRFIQRWADFLDSKEEYGMYLIQIYTDDIIYDTNHNSFNVFVNTYSYYWIISTFTTRTNSQRGFSAIPQKQHGGFVV